MRRDGMRCLLQACLVLGATQSMLGAWLGWPGLVWSGRDTSDRRCDADGNPAVSWTLPGGRFEVLWWGRQAALHSTGRGSRSGLGKQVGPGSFYDAIPNTGRAVTIRLAGWFRLETFELTRHQLSCTLHQRPETRDCRDCLGIASLIFAANRCQSLSINH